jgi:hypothetical protein
LHFYGLAKVSQAGYLALFCLGCIILIGRPFLEEQIMYHHRHQKLLTGITVLVLV